MWLYFWTERRSLTLERACLALGYDSDVLRLLK
ncbi:protein of unknown function [Kyrpidia spormannii]|uniref:Uncharacterized protein n=1 Tax=Kyrpidia spormannii TaxID=2055160 RepID=A0A6F9EIA3_9BACL|nr:protein of unknown function [Kyrpidia spormannii]